MHIIINKHVCQFTVMILNAALVRVRYANTGKNECALMLFVFDYFRSKDCCFLLFCCVSAFDLISFFLSFRKDEI